MRPGTTSEASPYFNGAEQAMPRALADNGSISGKQYLEPFKAIIPEAFPPERKVPLGDSDWNVRVVDT